MLRLKEVADVELGSEAYNFSSTINGKPCALATTYQTAGSNASAVINEIDAVLEEMGKDLPEGLEFVSLSDTNRFLRLYQGSSQFVTAGSPAGCACRLSVFAGYTLNIDPCHIYIRFDYCDIRIYGGSGIFHQPAYTLRTGACHRYGSGQCHYRGGSCAKPFRCRISVGLSGDYRCNGRHIVSYYRFDHDFHGGIHPYLIHGGTSGTFYTQFGITMAVAVGLSAINALTLSPALCALMLKPYVDESGEIRDNFAARFRKAYNIAFNALLHHYKKGVLFFIRRKWAMWGRSLQV